MRRSKTLVATFLLVAIILLLIGFSAAMMLFDWGTRHEQSLALSGVPILIAVLSGITLVLFRKIKAQRRATPTKTAKAAAAKPGPVRSTHPLILPAMRAAPQPDAPLRVPSPIESVRELTGPPPRVFPQSIQEYLHIVPPPWALKDLEMRVAYDRQDIIRRDGLVVWATFVQANKLIFKPGPADHPASMIFSEHQHYDDHAEELHEMARELFLLKGTDQADAESAAFARMLTSEMMRAPMLKVPSRFSNGRAVFHSSMMLPRKHLPKGVLSGWLVPVWVDPARTGALLMVPAAYWPASLLAAW